MPKQFRQATRCFRRLIISSVSIFLLFVLSANACDIVLKKHTIIPSDFIYLKDIASKYPKSVKNLFIADSPYINNPLVITKNHISEILKRKHLKMSVCGNSVNVERKKYLITKGYIQSLVKKKDIKILSKMPIVLPYDDYKIKLKKITKNGNFLYINIVLFRNKKLFRNIVISAKRNLKYVVPVAKFDIRRGQTITLNEITFKKIPNRLQRITLKSLQAIVGKVAITDIRQNQPFTSANTKMVKPVKRGDLVRVDVTDGAIRISTLAKALRGGFKNDIIPIMYLKSKRVAVATIVGKKEVQIR